MKLKNFLFVFLLSGLLFTGQVFASRDIKILVNGEEVKSDVMPVIENNRTLVPIRVISESLGYVVFWNDDNREVKITKDDKNLLLKIDSKLICLDDGKKKDEISIDAPAKIIKERTFVPLRAVAELFGEKVHWDADTATVYVGQVPETVSEQEADKKTDASLMGKVPVKGKTPESYLMELQEEVKDRGIVQYDEKQEVFSLTPKGLAANLYRYLRDQDHVDREFKAAFNDELKVIGDYSLKVQKETGIVYGLRITDPDSPEKTLVFIRGGEVVENNLKSVK